MRDLRGNDDKKQRENNNISANASGNGLRIERKDSNRNDENQQPATTERDRNRRDNNNDYNNRGARG